MNKSQRSHLKIKLFRKEKQFFMLSIKSCFNDKTFGIFFNRHLVFNTYG